MQRTPVALLIDDEPDLIELLELTLHKMDIKTKSAFCISDAKKLLHKEKFDLCLTDMRLPDCDGLELLIYIQKKWPSIPTIVITAHGTIETAIKALKNGAFDFITKPIELSTLRNLIKTAINLPPSQSNVDPSIKNQLLGNSTVIQELIEKIHKLARSEAPIFINGPSGSGKELVARLIHNHSSRCNNAFIAVNCGAIPKELMESEFFGHKKGSFTGAIQDKQGLFQVAQGGTLFLDEIGELPLNMQVKLLRAIQEKSIRPVGSTTESQVNTRILSATHQNLRDLVNKGDFREDLFYRINVIEIIVPSLKDHIEDLELLIQEILEKLSARSDIKKPTISKQSLKLLHNYDFPGNVRELENILERATTLCENNTIEPKDLQLPTNNKSFTTDLTEGLENYINNVEKNIIIDILEKNNWNKTITAEILKISHRVLRYKLKKLNIE